MNRFPRVLGVRTGYDPDQVDLLVRRIEGTLGRGTLEGEPITADEIRDARFRTKLGGYHELAVDFALEAFIVAIETRPTGRDARPPVPPDRPPVPWPTAPWETSAPREPATPWEASVSREQGWAEHRDPGTPWEASVSRGASGPWEQRSVEPQEPSVPREQGWAESAEPSLLEPRSGARTAGDAEREPDAGVPPELLGTDVVEDYAVRVERAAFRPGRLGMGYNEDQVDTFLDRIVATLRGTTDQPLTPEDVRKARFATVMLRPGYAVGEVDEFLADLAGVLEARFRG